MFDYETARKDVAYVGGDPDCVDYRNPEKRDKYLKKMGLRPKDYDPSLRHRDSDKKR